MDSMDSMEKESTPEEYIETLTEIEKLAMEIAKQHLGSSFDISKSNGFLKCIHRT